MENNKLQKAIPIIVIDTTEKNLEVNPPPSFHGFNFRNGAIRMSIQVQDMVGSRLFVKFMPNGIFDMTQQVGMYQVPVKGNWNYNPLTRQLSLQGVVNTFQPFILGLTLAQVIGDTVYATGSDGIGYLLTLDR